MLRLGYVYLDSLQVYSVHDGTLEEGDRGEVPLDQSLQLQPWRGSAKKQDDALLSTTHTVPCLQYESVLILESFKAVQESGQVPLV